MLDELMIIADFKTPLSHLDEKDPVDLIPASTKSKTWQEMERSKQEGHQEDIQQRHLHSSQPKCNTVIINHTNIPPDLRPR